MADIYCIFVFYICLLSSSCHHFCTSLCSLLLVPCVQYPNSLTRFTISWFSIHTHPLTCDYPPLCHQLRSVWFAIDFTRLLANRVLATGAIAQNVTSCVGGGVCYAVNIPSATASSGSGDIFIHVSGPSTLQWIGIGQGSQMAGSNIFMIYSNSAGDNVTVSPRLGTGERQPLTSGSTSEITLLSGSGIEDGKMTANFKCTSHCFVLFGASILTMARRKLQCMDRRNYGFHQHNLKLDMGKSKWASNTIERYQRQSPTTQPVRHTHPQLTNCDRRFLRKSIRGRSSLGRHDQQWPNQ